MFGTLIEKLKIKLWSRKQSTSTELRDYFREHFRIDVGLHSYGCFDQWRMPGPMKIGRYCSIARTVRYVPINHPYDALTTHPALYERRFGVVDTDIHWDDCLVIEDDIWIGHYAVILPSCKFIGRGAIIGAGAIVTKDVAPYSIMVGNPARKLKDRFTPDMVAQLEASQWWTMSIPELRALVAENPDLVFKPSVDRLAEWNAKEGRTPSDYDGAEPVRARA
ncbi:CatB-related O-acetyltransferase [Erythrobacter sp. LQ02-29]|uniref:CatB-related O-acetyltransferase n=1 Tax=Erythrobacter sp. LQ02-29 TaxID=2920384 RepID=UPI00277D069B|nr:CatB-related O-acetyltransferase [Erythrobacter sp. LQ02-29]